MRRRGRARPSSDRHSGLELPLSTLRMTGGTVTDDSRWAVDPDGLPGRTLVQSSEIDAEFRIVLDGPTTFVTAARLFPHDWRDGVGALRASVFVTYTGGARERLWAADLGTARAAGALSGAVCEVTLPASSTGLVLRFERLGAVPGPAVTRGAWVEPRLDIATETRAPAVPPTSSVTGAAPARGSGPLISVLMPVHDPPVQMLREAVESVRSQTFDDWQLCLVDDGSRDPTVIAAVADYAASDDRVRSVRHEVAGGISEATNSGIRLADGEYIALLDHDDILAAGALRTVADAIARDPDLDMLYTDEDILLDGRPVWTHRKPGWSPDTLRTNGYTCHLGVYRRSLVERIGGFRTEFNGSQDVDMILRLVEITDRIGHIPEVLYHWRMHVDSTAGGDAKPYAYVAATRAIAGHLGRSDITASVGFGPPGLYRVVHEVDSELSVDVALAVAEGSEVEGLARCASSLVEQPHRNWRMLIGAPADQHADVRSTLAQAGVDPRQIEIATVTDSSTHAEALALTTASVSSRFVLICERPVAGLTHDWLARLLGYAAQSRVAAAGPIVFDRNGLIEDAGIALPDGIPVPLLNHRRTSMDEFFGYGTSVYNVAALSGVLATDSAAFKAVGGLDSSFGALALTEYCLRATAGENRAVIVPDARLIDAANTPPVNDLPALLRLRAVHVAGDPYYNAGWRTDHGDFAPVAT